MNPQWWLVAPLVVAAALYAGWRLAPAALRARLRRALGLKPPATAPGADACANCREHKR
jgi:hypothetical protein